MDRAEEAVSMGALPLGLAPGARVIRQLDEGEIITWQDVQLDEQSAVVKLRRRQENLL
jgi:predicted homoserine dehydrogenase-like protein